MILLSSTSNYDIVYQWFCSQQNRIPLGQIIFDKDTKLVLLVSYATDEMIKITMMYPEVYFMDFTGQANHHRWDLFISVIRTPEGQRYMSNVTIIPSGKPVVMRLFYFPPN